MTVTELTTIHLDEEVASQFATTDIVKRHTSLLQTILDQSGCQSLYWGSAVEDARILYWLIDWDSSTSKSAFVSSFAYRNFHDSLFALCSTASTLLYDFPSPIVPIIATKPCIELGTITLGPTITPEKFVSHFDAVEKMITETNIPITKGWALGSSDRKEANEQKRMAAVVGWLSVDEHMKFRETAAGFADAMGPIMGMVEELNMKHVYFIEAKR